MLEDACTLYQQASGSNPTSYSVYATYLMNTTSKRKLLKTWQSKHKPLKNLLCTNLALLMHHARIQLPLLVDP